MTSLPFSLPYIPISIVGIQNAGKTTLLRWLKEGKFRRPEPTIGVELETATIKGLQCAVFDLSGQKSFREILWKQYVQSSVGIIYMLDSADSETMKESKKWYWTIINEWLSGAGSDKIILFLANKADLKKSLPLDDIINTMDLMKMAEYSNLNFQIFKVSIRDQTNLDYALKWFTRKIKSLKSVLQFIPKAVFVGTRSGDVLYDKMKQKIVKDNTFLAGYLKAISAFSDELLNRTELLKITKAGDYYFLTLEHGDLIITVAFDRLSELPGARRVAHMVETKIPLKETYFDKKALDDFLDKEVFFT
ncbi:MAG: ADP-ribosylation factor-like protein [Candidatus Heimdallarchaeaceae archaeon]